MSVMQAALSILRLYAVDKVNQIGFGIERPHLRQTTSEFDEYAQTFATNLSAFNMGSMMQMQADPTDSTAQCATDTALTNEQLVILADFAAYTTGGFDAGTFYNQLKIVQLKQMEQYASCDFIPLLIAMDAMLSKLPNAAAAGMNSLTQIGTGWTDKDTSIYIGYDKFVEGWEETDPEVRWEKWGAAAMLTGSQILKISAGSADIDVAPASS